MKKHYINPKTEAVTLSGAYIMLGASGDLHTKPTIPTTDQGENRAPGKVLF